MTDEKEIVEGIKKCHTKEELLAFFEKSSNNELQYWSENNYEAARRLLYLAMGKPETHYLPSEKEYTQKDLFGCDVEMFLTRTWEYSVNIEIKEGEAFEKYKTLKYLMGFWSGKDWQDFSKVKPPEKGQYLVFSNGGMSVDFWTGECWVGHLEKVDHWMNTPPAPMVGGALSLD